MSGSISIPTDELAAFCQRWGVTELSIFGSAVSGELRPESDVDVLIVIGEQASVMLDWDRWLNMETELRRIFAGREVDLVELRCVNNPFRRERIMSTRRVVYAA